MTKWTEYEIRDVRLTSELQLKFGARQIYLQIIRIAVDNFVLSVPSKSVLRLTR